MTRHRKEHATETAPTTAPSWWDKGKEALRARAESGRCREGGGAGGKGEGRGGEGLLLVRRAILASHTSSPYVLSPCEWRVLTSEWSPDFGEASRDRKRAALAEAGGEKG